MINDNTILSSFDDRPTLLEWLKKVEDALKTDTAKTISVENPEPLKYIFKITFADGTTLSSGNVVFPDSVKDVSIKNGHIIVTSVGGNVEDLGVLNPYADTIVVNAETNTTEIGGKLQVSGEAQVTGNVAMGGNLGVTGQAVVGGTLQAGSLQVTGNATIGGRLQTDSSIIANGEIRGGNISGTKFLLGTEEMPLVKANPTGEATQTLEKIKIGDVAYKVGGGGGGITKRTLTIPASELTPSPDDTKKAFFPTSRNNFFDSLFVSNGYLSLRLIYKEEVGGSIIVPLSQFMISNGQFGNFKKINYGEISQNSKFEIGKNEGDASYYFSTENATSVRDFIETAESFEFVVID